MMRANPEVPMKSTARTLPRMSAPHYEPKAGQTITIELPDERTRAVIERVISDEAVIVKLLTFTTSKSHNYRKGDMVPCRFQALDMGVPGWRAISDRELEDAEAKRQKKPKAGKK